MIPESRAEFKEHCLRSLGKPVLEINVDDTQVDDRIDEAISYYQLFHADALERAYIVHQVTANNVTDRYLTLDPSVVSVIKVLPPFDGGLSAEILFDPQSHFNMGLASSFTSGGATQYVIGRQYQQLISDIFRGRPSSRWTRQMNRLYIDVDWQKNFTTGSFVVIDCYKTIDPNAFIKIWGDRWLQRYGAALIKRQWGINLSKYNGIALPGGVTLDGKTILNDALVEIKTLEDEIQSTHQLPPMGAIG